jgi:flagellar biosynthesis chaperone FliJ
MSTALNGLGTSVGGWSQVGLGLSNSLGNELADVVEDVQTGLTDAIVMIEKAQSDLDELLELIGVKVTTATNKSVSMLMMQEELDSDAAGSIIGTIMDAISDVPKLNDLNGLLTKWLNEITPSLDVIGTWIVKFGTKIQSYISQLGTTIDRAQKTFDKILHMMMSSKGEDAMIFDTFNLYDMEHTGYITLFDVHEVGQSYAIDAYQGAAGTKLFKKYCGDNDRIEKGAEFTAFVNDPSVPYGMAILLRAYAKDMAQIGGEVQKAIKRSDMASAVEQYLTLTCARNLTKVQWVTQALTNGTLPQAFTACVLIELALNKNNPNALTVVDTGAMAVGAMITNNMTSVMDSIDLLHNPSFFTVQGFDVSDQPEVLEILTQWLVIGPPLWEKMLSTVVLLEVGEPTSKSTVPLYKIFQEMPKTARRLATSNVKSYKKDRARARIEKRQKKFTSKTTRGLVRHLTGGQAFTDMVAVESAAEQVVNGGVPCAPVTLEWAKWLAANATSTSTQLYTQSMDYAKGSSSTTDSFNTQIQGITKKVSSFVTVIESYASPSGIKSLEKKIEDFEATAMKEVLSAVENVILGAVKDLLKEIGLPAESSLLQTGATGNLSALRTKAGTRERAAHILSHLEQRRNQRRLQGHSEVAVSSVWSDVNTVLAQLYDILPSGVSALSDAKADVQQVYKTLESMFSMLSVKGPNIMGEAADIYKLIWILYFVVMLPFSLGMLYYGFWASGWFGGPQAMGKEEFTSGTFADQMAACWQCCCNCMASTCDSSLCFWSFIIFIQVVALLLFILSIVFVILGGIGILLATGCSEIYVLDDNEICQTSVGYMKEFLSTFTVGKDSGLNPLSSACGNHHLLMCEMISSDLISSAMYTIVGSFLACIVTFQLIFDVATLHERAIWMRKFAEEDVKTA